MVWSRSLWQKNQLPDLALAQHQMSSDKCRSVSRILGGNQCCVTAAATIFWLPFSLLQPWELPLPFPFNHLLFSASDFSNRCFKTQSCSFIVPLISLSEQFDGTLLQLEDVFYSQLSFCLFVDSGNQMQRADKSFFYGSLWKFRMTYTVHIFNNLLAFMASSKYWKLQMWIGQTLTGTFCFDYWFFKTHWFVKSYFVLLNQKFCVLHFPSSITKLFSLLWTK